MLAVLCIASTGLAMRLRFSVPRATSAVRQIHHAQHAQSAELLILQAELEAANPRLADLPAMELYLTVDEDGIVRTRRSSGGALDGTVHGPFSADSARLAAKCLRRLRSAEATRAMLPVALNERAGAVDAPVRLGLSGAAVRAMLAGALAARRRVEALEAVQAWLGLDGPPRLLEAFDVSHFGGEYTVVSSAVLVDGEPAPARHQRWPIQRAPAADDCAALVEGLRRRFAPAPQVGCGKVGGTGGGELEDDDGAASTAWSRSPTSRPLPHLILIDGGKGQLHAARSALATTEARHVPLIALAKGNETVYGFHTIGAAARNEGGGGDGVESASLLWLTPENADYEASVKHAIDHEASADATSAVGSAVGSGVGSGMPWRSPAGGAESKPLLLLRRARDEAHATALEGHRALREAAALESALTALGGTSGIGATRRAALFDHFGTYAALCEADVEALRRVPGIGRRLATSIVAGLQRAKASQGALGTTPSTGRIPLSRPLPPVLRLQTDPRPPPPPPPHSPPPPLLVTQVLRLPTDPRWTTASTTAAAIAASAKRQRRLMAHRLGIRGHQLDTEEAADEAALRATLSAALRFLHEIQLTRRPREPAPTTAPSSLDDMVGGLTDAPLLSPLLPPTPAPLLTPSPTASLKSSVPSLSAETLAAFEEVDAGVVEAAREAKREAVESFVGRDDLRAHRPFDLRSIWPPTAEQRGVVERLATSLAAPKVGPRRLVLKGATGTGKTFAMAQLIATTGRPTLVLAPNKVLITAPCT
jgi:hypothetical protein